MSVHEPSLSSAAAPPRKGALLIDVGGVLVREYLPGAADHWGARLGLSQRAFLRAMFEGNDDGVLVGRVGEDAWWRVIQERLGVGAGPIAEIRDDLAARETWDPELVARLRALRGAGGAGGTGAMGRVPTVPWSS
ncbi:hypothetical protein [Streptomyces sp. NPDC059009]|uniref:hypothetical protein n=1 Tax=Streptomyces sp. NPDC059009 TaxID=3346694 RepID=UPI0036C9731E